MDLSGSPEPKHWCQVEEVGVKATEPRPWGEVEEVAVQAAEAMQGLLGMAHKFVIINTANASVNILLQEDPEEMVMLHSGQLNAGPRGIGIPGKDMVAGGFKVDAGLLTARGGERPAQEFELGPLQEKSVNMKSATVLYSAAICSTTERSDDRTYTVFKRQQTWSAGQKMRIFDHQLKVVDAKNVVSSSFLRAIDTLSAHSPSAQQATPHRQSMRRDHGVSGLALPDMKGVSDPVAPDVRSELKQTDLVTPDKRPTAACGTPSSAGASHFGFRLFGVAEVPAGFMPAQAELSIYSESQRQWLPGTLIGVAVDDTAGKPVGSLLVKYRRGSELELVTKAVPPHDIARKVQLPGNQLHWKGTQRMH